MTSFKLLGCLKSQLGDHGTILSFKTIFCLIGANIAAKCGECRIPCSGCQDFDVDWNTLYGMRTGVLNHLRDVNQLIGVYSL